MMTTLYGIKNCDTVKKARDWLTTRDIAFHFHDFRTDGLSQQQVASWITEIGLDALINKRSTTWKELDETIKTNFNEQNAAAVITQHPTLIKRPLLITATQKHLGFKAADYEKIFG